MRGAGSGKKKEIKQDKRCTQKGSKDIKKERGRERAANRRFK